MKNNLTNKPTNAVKPLLSSRGFALIATISILSLIALISLALLSLATTKTKVSSYSNHLNIARDNARLALEIAIGQLQKYTGPDQRVTARADILDKDWTDVKPQVANPYYHLAWDVSGSEIDYAANWKGYSVGSYVTDPPAARGWPVRFNERGAYIMRRDFDGGSGSSWHRPGMNPAHDFRKKPAVLVSGNEFYDLTDPLTGKYNAMFYPVGYVTAEDSLAGKPSVEIIPSKSILAPGSLDTGSSSPIKVEVPIVKIVKRKKGDGEDAKDIEEHGSYAYWIGDESLKTRVNLESDLSKATGKIAQRSPIVENFQASVVDSKVSAKDVAKRISMSSLELNASTEKKGFSYSPDITTSSESLVVDVRNGGFKQDFTNILYNPSSDFTAWPDLQDDSVPLDQVLAPTSADLNVIDGNDTISWTQYWSPGSALLPLFGKWRSLARDTIEEEEVNEGQAVNVGGVGEKGKSLPGVYPVISQVQLSQHLAYRKENGAGTEFSVFLFLSPSVTLWNPYDVPLRLTKEYEVKLLRRVQSLRSNRENWQFSTQYQLEGDPAPNGSPFFWTGNFKIDFSTPETIQPGETMIFSATETTLDEEFTELNTTINKLQAIASKRISVNMTKGDRPGYGKLVRLNQTKHSTAAYGGSFPKVSLVQPNAQNALVWRLVTNAEPGFPFINGNRQDTLVMCSNWSGLGIIARDEDNNDMLATISAYVTAPEIPIAPLPVGNTNLSTSGVYPAALIKHSLRMGDDYLTTPANYLYGFGVRGNRRWDSGSTSIVQRSRNFHYMTGQNPAAISHRGFSDSNNGNRGLDATSISRTLMGGIYGGQAAADLGGIETRSPSGSSFVADSAFIGLGYSNGDKFILMNRLKAASGTNGASAALTSFSQLNNSQFLKGRRQSLDDRGRDELGFLSSSNIAVEPIGNSLGKPTLPLRREDESWSWRPQSRTYYYGSIGKYFHAPRDIGFRLRSMEMDYSYLLNDYLYDHYFFSTIPQSETDYTASEPLVNSRLVPDASVKTNHAELKAIDVAKHLKMVGGFNVNSTSVPAWEMLLSSSLGTTRGGVSASESTVSFSNKPTKTEDPALDADEITKVQALDSNYQMKLGQRNPTKRDLEKDPDVEKIDKVRELAEAMVSEVKRRGPFPSLSAFVNRASSVSSLARTAEINSEPGTKAVNDSVGRNGIVDARFSGAIQSALDRIDANDALESASPTEPWNTGASVNTNNYSSISYATKEALRKSIYSHLPGYLKQSDVLAQIAPVVTVRGDTFTIRCFGASGKGPDGKPIAKAVCEAVVQRGKEFVDPTNTKEVAVNIVKTHELTRPGASVTTTAIPTTSGLTEVNQRFGRKYKIVSFKWLSQTEVNKMELSDL